MSRVFYKKDNRSRFSASSQAPAPLFPAIRRERLGVFAARPCSAKSHGGDDFEKRARLTKSKILSLSSFSVSPYLPTFRGCVLRQYHTPLTFIVHCPLSLLPLPMIIITIIYTNLVPPGFLGATRPKCTGGVGVC